MPICVRRIGRANNAVTAMNTTVPDAANPRVFQLVPARLPAPHKLAMIASSTVAVSSSHVFTAASIALTPIPTMMSLTPRAWPSFDARKNTVTAVSKPPASAPSRVAVEPPRSTSIAMRAPV